MFRLRMWRRIISREQYPSTCRCHKLKTEMRIGLCNQARLQIVGLPSRWDDDQRRQRAVPRLGQNSFEPGSNRIVPRFP